jgi:hypothetical protein
MNQQIKYDKQGRVLQKIDDTSGLIYMYKYHVNTRIVKITTKNASKNKTIIVEELINESEYKILEKKDMSEKYIVQIFYDEFGREKKIVRKNRKNRKKYTRQNILFKNNEPSLWVEEYSNKKEFGFKLDI